MLVFFIHGVNTKDANYADILIRKIRNINKKSDFSNTSTERKKVNAKYKRHMRYPLVKANLYSGFWGNLFNNKKQQAITCIKKDFSRACRQHEEYHLLHRDMYRYKSYRYKFINEFLGDFLIYQNPRRGAEIRKTLYQQLNQFIEDHPNDNEIHFIAHSLGSVILWDLLFSEDLPKDDPGYHFRNILEKHKICSITTMGSPLLFLKQMFDLDFSLINNCVMNLSTTNTNHLHKIRWVNIIHSSDMIAYPLKAAIEDEINSDILFFDQYVWQDGNGKERGLRTIGSVELAMVVGASDAHSSYFADNIDGSITARIIGYNLLGETEKLFNRCVTPR
ncbi:conserved hypothetical protein [Hyella patelloides LEGE 07179]|uniref:Uncharacterized protein n=1 Tax=Hyella patelloides LEGE 07179 TaxID=945734 RepID=A0A563W0F6_9CYAN|nr:hypothetical protein [Hyella patelloides]VEP17169.1 conserved hypothetical protein [Hyella patelloides LEGE 07179]